MKTAHPAGPESGPPGLSTPSAAPTLQERGRALRQACRQVFGIPDYDRYLAHQAEHHPGEPLLSRREFYAQSIERKYGKGGPRCC